VQELKLTIVSVCGEFWVVCCSRASWKSMD
jgi:hypothetical protein